MLKENRMGLTNQVFQYNFKDKENARCMKKCCRLVVPIYKKKGDMKSCLNYCWIKLTSHTMNLWHSLKQKTNIFKKQFGFIPDRSTAIYIYIC